MEHLANALSLCNESNSRRYETTLLNLYHCHRMIKYEKLQESFLKPFAFRELARKHSKFINEILPKSKFSEFIKRAFVVPKFKDKIIQVLSIFNYADLRPQVEDPLSIRLV
jgi:hypothetical protein